MTILNSKVSLELVGNSVLRGCMHANQSPPATSVQFATVSITLAFETQDLEGRLDRPWYDGLWLDSLNSAPSRWPGRRAAYRGDGGNQLGANVRPENL